MQGSFDHGLETPGRARAGRPPVTAPAAAAISSQQSQPTALLSTEVTRQPLLSPAASLNGFASNTPTASQQLPNI
jgi:hypothetical protein